MGGISGLAALYGLLKTFHTRRQRQMQNSAATSSPQTERTKPAASSTIQEADGKPLRPELEGKTLREARCTNSIYELDSSL